MDVKFPIFVADPEDPAWLYAVESLDLAEGGEIEMLDVQDGNFVFWDASGLRLHAEVRHSGRHWLKLTSTGVEDMNGLLEAIGRYGEALKLPDKQLRNCSPYEALKHIEAHKQRPRDERHKRRPWYHFWRRH